MNTAHQSQDFTRSADSALLIALIDNSDDAIVSMTTGGLITTWNRAAERIYGFTAQEITGAPFSRLAHPDRPNEMPEMFAAIRAGKHVDHYETVRMRKEGKAINVSLSVSPICDEEGRLIGISSIHRRKPAYGAAWRTPLLSRPLR